MNVSIDTRVDDRLVLLFFTRRQAPAPTEEVCAPLEELLAKGAVMFDLESYGPARCHHSFRCTIALLCALGGSNGHEVFTCLITFSSRVLL